MKPTICGRIICPGICPSAERCEAGQKRSRAALAAYAIKLAQRRFIRLQIQPPLVITELIEPEFKI